MMAQEAPYQNNMLCPCFQGESQLTHPCIVAFGKNPHRLPVKTRLARDVGPELAARVYTALLDDCLAALSRNKGACLYLGCYPEADHQFFRERMEQFQLHALTQQGEDLGERMLRTMEFLLPVHSSVVIVGTDVPVLPVEELNAALAGDIRWDILIGPAPDGGYYALGVRSVHGELFSGVTWSTSNVMKDTVGNAARLGLSVKHLSEAADLDDGKSLERLISDLERSPGAAPELRQILTELNA